jgi:YegS/Rv2252/BmrU family lipid kinase
MPQVRQAAVILNPSSGQKQVSDEDICTALKDAGIHETEVIQLAAGIDLSRTVADCIARKADVVIAAGGDGTVSSVAACLADSETRLGVLPVGTLNHFAKDIGIPTDLKAAVKVIADGNVIHVDAAKVNDRIFINNSSIGVYPAMVRIRDRFTRRGIPKMFAMPLGAIGALWEFPNTSVRLTTPDGRLSTRTPFVFVGNNEYELSGLELGTRTALHDGELQVCVVRKPSRAALLGTMLKTAVRGADAAPELEAITVRETVIETFRRNIHVAVDGEVVKLQSPLRYTICPGALRVIAPANGSK